jgi:hypothetical protein
MRVQPWQLAVILVALCAAVIGGIHWQRSRRSYDAAQLIADLPRDHATLVYLDTALLRDSGILDMLLGPKAAEEPEYQRFVQQTGFDYRTDLDAVAGSFVNGAKYFVLKGRFRWKELTQYAKAQGGSCQFVICSLPGSSPERNISFFPLTNSVLALAVSADPRGVSMIGTVEPNRSAALPPEPIWISVPGATFTEKGGLPAAALALLSPLQKADRTIFAVGPKGSGFELRMDATCAQPDAAASLAKDLSGSTQVLKKLVGSEPGGGIGSLLTAGVFEQKENRVAGSWPIQRKFLEAIAAGKAE